MEIINIKNGFSSSNTYLLVDRASGEAAIVDPSGKVDKLIYAIQSNAVKVTSILLTHGHYDHILSLKEMREYTKAPVYIHRLDAACLTEPSLSMMSLIGRDDRFEPAEVLLEGGDTVRVGESSVSVMHTPGHTAGSVCYITDAGIISGDTLFYESIGRTDFASGSFESIRASLARIYALDGDAEIYPGHGIKTTLEHERIYNPYVRMGS